MMYMFNVQNSYTIEPIGVERNKKGGAKILKA